MEVLASPSIPGSFHLARLFRLANPESITVAVNQPGVHLIDTSESKGVEQITEKGLLHEGVEYEVDCIM